MQQYSTKNQNAVRLFVGAAFLLTALTGVLLDGLGQTMRETEFWMGMVQMSAPFVAIAVVLFVSLYLSQMNCRLRPVPVTRAGTACRRGRRVNRSASRRYS